MSPEKQRIAIAEMNGFVRDEICECWEKDGVNYFADGSHLFRQIPDYLNDLNHAHQMERDASYHTGDYCRILMQVTSGGSLENMTQYNLLHATATQRCEAFLKTVGRWEP